MFLFFTSKIIRKHWFFNGYFNWIFKSSDPGLHMKEVRKDENEKWTSKVSVITPGLEKADSLTSCPLQVNDESTSGEMDQDEGR